VFFGLLTVGTLISKLTGSYVGGVGAFLLQEVIQGSLFGLFIWAFFISLRRNRGTSQGTEAVAALRR